MWDAYSTYVLYVVEVLLGLARSTISTLRSKTRFCTHFVVFQTVLRYFVLLYA